MQKNHTWTSACAVISERIAKCETEEELRASGNGVTADCYSYNNYIFRHLKKNDYEKYACIGTKVSKAKLREMEDEVLKLSEEVLQDQQMQQSLKAAQGFERLNQSTDQILHLTGAGEELQAFLRETGSAGEGTARAS